ncbi:MAG TPA: fluoride efflux transporter CrcB [Gemmatimonadales bacterium]
MSAKLLAYLAAGGIAGTLSRYLLNSVLQPPTSTFPWATLAINVAGSFVLGFLMRFLMSSGTITPELRAGLTVGFCGAFTTMSTFSYETMSLVNAGYYGRAGVYVAASVGGSIAAAALGLAAGTKLL